jgi:metal-dependent HD superfamily phosphatase/phosphodiesterase
MTNTEITKKDLIENGNSAIDSELADYPAARKFADELRSNKTILAYQNQANVMAVKRLSYNDHGPVHATIVSGNALKILRIMESKGVPLTSKDNPGFGPEEARIIVFAAAFLHDIGNCVHRDNHEMLSVIVTKPILEEIIGKLYPEEGKKIALLCDILHAVLSHDESEKAVTTEAGMVKIADGTDCTEGRSRVPYKLGDYGIHSMSARSITRVNISEGTEKPLKIDVFMRDPAGIFQIEGVMMAKIKSSGLADKVEVVAYIESENNKEFRF